MGKPSSLLRMPHGLESYLPTRRFVLSSFRSTLFPLSCALRNLETRQLTYLVQIHILGGYKNVQLARNCVCNLILGKQPGKVYNTLRNISARMKERF